MKCYEGSEPRIIVTDEFIEKNKLAISMDGAKKAMVSDDPFSFKKEVAIRFLSLEDAKPYITEKAFEEFKNGDRVWKHITDIKEAAQDFLDYMVFAWMKAVDGRGLSSIRSIDKLSTWMTILGREDVAETLQREDLYAMYGRPALREACKMLGIKYPDDL